MVTAVVSAAATAVTSTAVTSTAVTSSALVALVLVGSSSSSRPSCPSSDRRRSSPPSRPPIGRLWLQFGGLRRARVSARDGHGREGHALGARRACTGPSLVLGPCWACAGLVLPLGARRARAGRVPRREWGVRSTHSCGAGVLVHVAPACAAAGARDEGPNSRPHSAMRSRDY